MVPKRLFYDKWTFIKPQAKQSAVSILGYKAEEIYTIEHCGKIKIGRVRFSPFSMQTATLHPKKLELFVPSFLIVIFKHETSIANILFILWSPFFFVIYIHDVITKGGNV